MRVIDILLDKRSYKTYKNTLIHDISLKTFIGAKPLRIWFEKQMDLLKFMMELDIQYYLLLKDLMQFIIALNTL